MVNLKTLHPDDLLFFGEVSAAMRRVANRYGLPLRSISPATMPADGMVDYLGRCFSTGDIELVMRATVNGQFVNAPRSPENIWTTAAHELAHLRHMNHGKAFSEFHAEMVMALDNQREDHKARVIAKLVKMQKSRDGEAAIGNINAAEAFAGAINRMLIEYELHPSDIDYATATADDPVIEMQVNLIRYGIDKKKSRLAWQESLARIVAAAHLCQYLVRPRSNDIWFVGTRSHATVAEYVFGTLVPTADRMSYLETRKYSEELKKRTGSWAGVNGFREAWLDAFIARIKERFEDARKSAVTEAVVDLPPGSESQALVRLNSALVKVSNYVDDKFKARRGRSKIHALSTGRSTNAEGHKRGRAAADAMPISRRGVTSAATRGLLGSGEK